jgi:SAM-dependent methyltransferase
VSGDVLEHVPDKNQYLKETFRVLKENGIFIINTPTIGTPAQRFHGSLWYFLFLFGAFIQKISNKIIKKPHDYTDLDVPEGVLDEPSDEKWLYSTLNKVGYSIIFGKRSAPHIPFGLDGKFWRKLADNFVDENYGNSMFFVCRKTISESKNKDIRSIEVLSKDKGYLGKKLCKISNKFSKAFNFTE